MQNIQDKDLNGVLQQKFENFEVEPSSAVWRGIAAELDNSRHKKPFPVFIIMAAAASVLIILSTGLWLFSPKEKIRLHGKTNDVIIKDELPDNTVKTPAIKEAGKQLKKAKQVVVNTPVLAQTNPLIPVAEQQVRAQETARPAEAPAKEIELAKTENTILKDEKSNSWPDQHVLALANEQSSATDSKEYNPQRRIKNVGDVVNLLVGKVDPRQDKIIQFRNDGDGGSEVSGINLGLFKIKSRKK